MTGSIDRKRNDARSAEPAAAGTGGLPRISYLLHTLFLTVFLCSTAPMVRAEMIVIEGESSVTIDPVALDQATVKLGAASAALKREGSQASLRGSDGSFLAHALLKEGRVALNDADGREKFSVEFDGPAYRIRETGFLRYRVKIKEDKFNIYGENEQRILHGKRKDSQWSVKREDGTKALTVRGTQSLRETSYLAVPIPPEFRVVLWSIAPRQ